MQYETDTMTVDWNSLCNIKPPQILEAGKGKNLQLQIVSYIHGRTFCITSSVKTFLGSMDCGNHGGPGCSWTWVDITTKLDKVAPSIADPPGWNSTNRQNPTIWDPPPYIAISFEQIIQSGLSMQLVKYCLTIRQCT